MAASVCVAGAMTTMPTTAADIQKSAHASQTLDNATCQTCHDGKKSKIEVPGADGENRPLHDIAPDNTCYVWGLGDKAAVDKAFASAHHVTTLQFVNNRLIPNAIEPRAANAQYSRSDESYTLYVANQNPHVERLLMTAFVLGLPEHKVRVVAPDVGGGFGSKIYLYAEDVVLTWAAKQVNRPVKWTAERAESFQSDAHGRDHVTRAELALDREGRFLGMRVMTTANVGAYLSTFASCVPTILYATLLAGQYTTPLIYCEVTAVFTNTAPVDAYRGAGRPEATYVVERLVETAAREMNLEPAEIRRRNFIRQFPYQTPVALQYDTGNYEATLAEAIQAADVAGFPGRKAEAAKRGKLRGLGYACYIEACGIAPSNIAGSLGARAGLFEAGEVRVHPTGKVTVFTGSHSHGQGHETTFAQVVASRLGIAVEDVDIVHGDTGKVLFGMGTYGSRSIAVGGTAIVKALDKIVAKGRKIAAHLLEASEADIEFKDGVFRVAGTDKQAPFAQVSLAAYVPHNYPLDKLEPGLNENAFYDPTNFTFPAGSYVCEVEVDPETGSTQIVNFTAVDDFGRIINPMIVEGQVHGGLDAGLLRAAGGRRSFVQDRHQGNAVHAQSARREGMRRSRRDRIAGGADQRPHRRARSARPGDARDAPTGVARGQQESSVGGTRYVFIQVSTREVRRGRVGFRRQELGRQAALGRTELDRDDEAAPVTALGPGRSGRAGRIAWHQGRRQHGYHRRDDAPRGGRRIGRGEESDSGAGVARLEHRRPSGAQHGYDRRLGRAQ